MRSLSKSLKFDLKTPLLLRTCRALAQAACTGRHSQGSIFAERSSLFSILQEQQVEHFLPCCFLKGLLLWPLRIKGKLVLKVFSAEGIKPDHSDLLFISKEWQKGQKAKILPPGSMCWVTSKSSNVLSSVQKETVLPAPGGEGPNREYSHRSPYKMRCYCLSIVIRFHLFLV